MKTVFKLFLITALLGLVGCGTVQTTKTTKYGADGKITEVIETTSDASDFANYFATGEGNATDLRGDITKFTLGWNGYGLNWLSISGGRTKAPVKPDGSTSAEALKEMAGVIKANKTSVSAGEIKVE